MRREWTRRSLLRAVAVTGFAGVAGCSHPSLGCHHQNPGLMSSPSGSNLVDLSSTLVRRSHGEVPRGQPRGFTVLTARPKTGRAIAGEFNSPRPSQEGSAGINTRTLGASVRVGGSTPPDNSRRTTPKTWILRGVAFPNRLSQRWIKVFNPSLWVSDCVNGTNRGLLNLSTAFTLGVKPRGTRPVPPVEYRDPQAYCDRLQKTNPRRGGLLREWWV